MIGGINSPKLGTKINASGVAVDFSGLPQWMKRVTISVRGLSTNGGASVQAQLGVAGILKTSGYTSAAADLTTVVGVNVSATGFIFSSPYSGNGSLILTYKGDNIWNAHGLIFDTASTKVVVSAGSVVLSGALDIIRITTSNGTDAFDDGSINILYE